MPRWLIEGRYWDRIREHAKAAEARRVLEYWQALDQDPGFIDYYPDMLATRPEKHLFRALVERRVNFYLAPYWGDFPFTPDLTERARPDFLLPDYRIIIEVQSVYWHSRWGMPQHDAIRHALYVASGFQVYYFTDEEILIDVNACLDSIPELRHPAILGDQHIVARRPQDPVAAIVARLKKWPKVVRTKHRQRARGSRVLQRFMPTGRRPRKMAEQRFALHKELSEEMMQQATQLHRDWVQYMDQLRRAIRHGYRGPYYWYYQRWRNYLNRWSL